MHLWYLDRWKVERELLQHINKINLHFKDLYWIYFALFVYQYVVKEITNYYLWMIIELKLIKLVILNILTGIIFQRKINAEASVKDVVISLFPFLLFWLYLPFSGASNISEINLIKLIHNIMS